MTSLTDDKPQMLNAFIALGTKSCSWKKKKKQGKLLSYNTGFMCLEACLVNSTHTSEQVY